MRRSPGPVGTVLLRQWLLEGVRGDDVRLFGSSTLKIFDLDIDTRQDFSKRGDLLHTSHTAKVVFITNIISTRYEIDAPYTYFRRVQQNNATLL